MLWHKVDRAVQCADAGINDQDKVDTELFLFDPRQSHEKKKENRNSEATIRIAMLHGLSSSSGVNH